MLTWSPFPRSQGVLRVPEALGSVVYVSHRRSGMGQFASHAASRCRNAGFPSLQRDRLRPGRIEMPTCSLDHEPAERPRREVVKMKLRSVAVGLAHSVCCLRLESPSE